MTSLFIVLDLALDMYLWVIIISAIVSWLVAFNVINVYNPAVRAILGFMHQITEPVLARIRRFLPSIGGVDLSPIVVILVIVFLRNLMREYGPL
ncbi:MAG: YggT family protein [Alphaproteobacteria bacterium]|nr:MAG: YggT family protein [Alphaproteobacteria bacterium]